MLTQATLSNTYVPGGSVLASLAVGRDDTSHPHPGPGGGTTRGRCTRNFLLVGPLCGVMCVVGAIAEKKQWW